MSKNSIGIYLGDKYAAVAYKNSAIQIIQTGPNNEELCATCVALDRNGNFIVGNRAYNAWKRYTPNIVVSIKQLLGASINDNDVKKMIADKRSYPFGIKKMSGGTEDNVAIILQGKEYTPEQICAELLRSLKNDADKIIGDVEYAVITVPAYFNQKQTTAIRKAAKLAGLKVLTLLPEPIAAAISFKVDKLPNKEEKVFVVYDFSENRFDLTILVSTDGSFIECGAGGDRWLGGNDIDVLLYDYVIQKIENDNNIVLQDLFCEKTEKEVNQFTVGLKADVENAKKDLSQNTKATIYVSNYLEDKNNDFIDDIVITRESFESLIRPLVQRTIDLIEDLLEKTGVSADDISNILLVGGSSNIPLVKRMLVEKYGEETILSAEKPMLAIVQGAAILAASMDVSNWKDEKDGVLFV